ncbi:MAG: DUF5372 family protein [Pseudonocardiaceae bacterium]
MSAAASIAVGTVLAGGPRTDRSVRNYRTGLLPWVRASKRIFGEGMRHAGTARSAQLSTESSTACDRGVEKDPVWVRVTHRFHPLFGRELEFVKRRRNWPSDRVYFFDEAGELGFRASCRRSGRMWSWRIRSWWSPLGGHRSGRWICWSWPV